MDDRSSTLDAEDQTRQISPAPTGDSGSSRWRNRLATLCLVIFMVSAGVAVPAVWVRNQMLDTDRFVNTVAPLSTNEAIESAVAGQIASHISSFIATSPAITSIEGDNAALGALVPMAATAAIDSVTRSVVASPAFASLWESAARIAHRGFQALLDGGSSELLSTESGQVAIDLSPVVAEVNTQLAARGIQLPAAEPQLHFVLFESQTLSDVQNIVKFTNELAVLATIVAVLALTGYIALSTSRRGALVVAGLGLAMSMAVVLLFLALGEWLYERELSNTVDKEAATATFDILVRNLRGALRILGLGGLLIAALAWFTRRKAEDEVPVDDAGLAGSLIRRWPALGRLEHAVAIYRPQAYTALGAVVVAMLLISDTLTLARSLGILAFSVLVALLIHRARPLPEELRQSLERSAAPLPPAGESLPASLRQLADLNTAGLLTDEEFSLAKARLLAGSS